MSALSTEPLPVEVNSGQSWPIRLTAGVDARTGQLVPVPTEAPVATTRQIKSPDQRRPTSRNSRSNLSPMTFVSPTTSPAPEARIQPPNAAELSEFEIVANLVAEAVSPLAAQAPSMASVVNAAPQIAHEGYFGGRDSGEYDLPLATGRLKHATSTRPRPAGRRKPSRTSITNLRTSPEAKFDTPC